MMIIKEMTSRRSEAWSMSKDVDKSSQEVGIIINSGIGLSITIDELRVFINKTLSIDGDYRQLVDSR
jgi:hypothetical protein